MSLVTVIGAFAALIAGSGTTESLTPLQVAYAVDSVGNDRIADDYVAANAVTNWDNVMSVTISLLLQSAEQGPETDSKTYELLTAALGGQEFGPFDDRRMRMVFTTTIALRNRAL